MTTYARPCPAPINTLPVELLSYIFVLGTHCTSDVPSDDIDPTPQFTAETVKMPLALASVSRYWRRVALSTPRLWTSICITMQMVQVSETGTTSLDSRHITSYLSLSRQYPLDILIDARDYEWDFLEDDVSIPGGEECYTPPFSSSHMKTVFDLLAPHISRWRSLSILTDTWKPMHTALQSINNPLLSQGAPLLESLSLMRCNDFISFGPEFQPASLKSPAFLSPSDYTSPRHSGAIFPRMKHLALRGVHVDWASLGSALSATRMGLRSLELGSHCADVRPTVAEFHTLLEASPYLRKLIVSGSGPSIPTAEQEGPEKVLLSQLKGLTVGYRAATDGEIIFPLLDAPALTSLTLEEATYPADPEEIEAGSLLTYLGSGEFHTVKESTPAASEAAGVLHYPTKQRKDSTSSIASTSTCVGSGIEIDGRIYEDDDDMTLVDFDMKPHPPFPLLECVALKGVRSSSSLPFSTFLGSANRLQRLELDGMSMQAVLALGSERIDSKIRPTASSSSALTPTPICPLLKSLSLRSYNLQLHDLQFILNRLISHRSGHQTSSLRNIDVYLCPGAPIFSSRIGLGDGSDASIGDALEVQNPVSMEKAGVTVSLFGQVEDPADCEEEDDWDRGLAEEAGNAFSVGGAFNDPHFDAYYGSLFLEGETR